MINIEHLIKEMPVGYEAACFSEKAIERKRNIKHPNVLMKLCLLHLLNGCSLAEVSAIASIEKLGEVSNVAFMKRFEKCNGWFKWIISQLVASDNVLYQKPEWLKDYRVIAVDASDVREKGCSGRLYRLHFALDLFKMEGLQYKITTNKTGETLRNFEVNKGDLFIADRAYISINGIEHCLNKEGNFIIRLRKNSFKLYDSSDKMGEEIDLLSLLKRLGDNEEVLDLNVYANGSNGERIPLRVCAKRKNPDALIKTQKRLKRTQSKSGRKISECAKAFNEYIVLITNLRDKITTNQVLETYRLRWQVEIYFKRLKSIMDFGELPKRREESIMTWLNGKLMIMLMIENIIREADFSP